MGIETAIIGGALISGYASSRAADKASDAQREGYDAATAEQRRQYDLTRADYAPYREAGANALNRLEDPNAFTESPGYGFVKEQGLDSLENRFSVRGGGGNAMKALNEFNSGLASQEYGNWWNREATKAGYGMAGTSGTANAGTIASGNISNNMIGAADARASGVYNKYAGVNNAIQSGLGNYLYAQNRGLFDPKKPEHDFQGRRINYGG